MRASRKARGIAYVTVMYVYVGQTLVVDASKNLLLNSVAALVIINHDTSVAISLEAGKTGS